MTTFDNAPPPEGWRLNVGRMYHATCPKCHEFKFIGHGPLCLDCFNNPREDHLVRGEN